MGMSIATNVTSLSAYHSLSRTNNAMQKSLERLSSGYRINRASDDAAGLGISEGLRAQIGGMTQAVRNTQDGISVVQIAEGALGESTAILQRMRDLAVEGANDGVLNRDSKQALQTEMDQLSDIAGRTNFNGVPLLDGSYSRVFQVGANVGETIDIGIGTPGHGMDPVALGIANANVVDGSSVTATSTPAVSAAQGVPTAGTISFAGDFVTPGAFEQSYRNLTGTVTYKGTDFDLGSVDYSGATTSTDYATRLFDAMRSAFGSGGVPGGIVSGFGTASALEFSGEIPGPGSTASDAVAMTPTFSGHSGAGNAITLIDRALTAVSSTRADLGAVQNRLQHTVDRLQVTIENTTASESRIRDTDMAKEMSNFSRTQVLTQAGTAMLSQATQAPQSLLKLLTG
jgi:flagellin